MPKQKKLRHKVACEAGFTPAEHEGFGGMGPSFAEGEWGSDPHNKKVTVSFWGVQGAIAGPQVRNLSYGGNTACVAIHHNHKWFICDAGTGIRRLGKKLTRQREPITILFSHLHWDHIFGLPFFWPLYQKQQKILLAGPGCEGDSFKQTLGRIIRQPFFPIRPNIWQADIKWRSLNNGRAKLNSVTVESREVAHRGGITFGFQFYFLGGKRVVYVTDQELQANRDKKFIQWIEGADLFIHDSEYDRREYAKREGWGHSAFEDVLELAIQAKVKRFVLFHHDPDANNALLKKRLKWCQRTVRLKKSSVKCYLAKEGLTLKI